MVSYSFLFVISGVLINNYNVLVFYFYEVEVGLPVVLVGIAFIIYALWNMINDPIVGYLTDRPLRWTRKWGLRAPWIVFSVIPTILLFFLLFIPPNINPKINPWPVFWYMVLMTCLYDTFYSIYTEHFSGGFANQFRSDEDRRKASIYTQIMPVLFGFIIGLVPLVFIEYGNKSSFEMVGLLLFLILGILFIVSIPGIKESEEVKERYLQGYKNKKTISFFKLIKIAMTRKNFMLSLLAYTLYTAAYTLYQASIIYFVKDILRLELDVAIFFNISYFLGALISAPLWGRFAKRVGHITTYILGLLLMGVSFFPLLWISTLIEVIVYSVLGGIANSCFTIMVMPIVSDCYDEVSVIIGKHQEATLLGIRNFFIRISLILQGIIISLVHVLTGYNPNPNAIQTRLALFGIRIHMGLIPTILCILGALGMIFWYDLKGEKKKVIQQKLQEMGL
ncbi:MAG: MFS transporter [Promethearchaeota archaeon]